MIPTDPHAPSNYWPESGQAAAQLAHVQKLLDARKLTGTERQLKPLMRRITTAFRERDLTAVTAACAALIDAIEQPQGSGTNP